MPQEWSEASSGGSALVVSSDIALRRHPWVEEKTAPGSELDVVDVHLLEIGVARFTVAWNLPFRVHDNPLTARNRYRSGQ